MKAVRNGLALAETGKGKEPAKDANVPRVVTFARTPAILEFQADAVELEERAPPVLARMTLYFVALFLGCAVLWASLSMIDKIVVAPGKLITTEPMFVVQPLETSVIRSIDARIGDVVRAGQTLATLDPTFVTADAEQLRARIQGFDAQIGRIKAELENRPYVAGPDAGPDRKLQAQLFTRRKAFYDARLQDFATRMAHTSATLDASRNEEEVIAQRLVGLHEIDKMKETLFDKGAGSRLTYLQGRDLSLEIEADLGRIRGTQFETAELLDQVRAERQTFIEDSRRVLMENLVELRDRRSVAIEEAKKAELRKALSVLVAPADSTVLDVAQRSIGSVVREAEPLFTLVPLNVPLEVEVSVASKDIGYIEHDDMARIKFDAFPFQKHGTVNGKVLLISQDTFAPDVEAATGEQAAASFYKARLALEDLKLESLPEDFLFIPGMTVQAEIRVGRRSVISYFLYPLLRGFDESLREP